MLDIIDFEQLKNVIKVASKKIFENIQIKYPNETVSGFALCTDDSAMTIYHIANTREWTEKGGNIEYEYSPVEWQYNYDDKFFDEAYNLIMERVEKQYEDEYEDKFEEIVDLTFNSFVTALFELRNEGVFPGNVFLSVISTDPSDHMLELESAANRMLNNPLIISKWEEWCEKYN